MRRRRTAASLGALLLATLFAASPAPAAAWVDVYHSGTYYDQPNIYDEDGLPGVNCLFTDNAGTAHDWIDRIKVNQLNSHSPYHKKSYVGFRMVVGRNTPPLDDTAFTPYYTSPEVKKLATDETVAFFTRTWNVPDSTLNRASQFRVVVQLRYYKPNGTYSGELRARMQVYRQKLGPTTFVIGSPPSTGWCQGEFGEL
ncbi:MAG: hypothetical protein U0869_16205 [Chloroflexota bacterium]